MSWAERREGADAVAELLRNARLVTRSETDLQGLVEETLRAASIVFEAQVPLGVGGALGRIDLYVPDLKLGIELKVQGTPTAVAAQLLRYAQSSMVDTLLLVTGRSSLGHLPHELMGKPLTVVRTWRGGL